MINKLTTEQLKQLDVYKNKYLALGLNTNRFDCNTAQQISDYYYQNIVSKKTVPVVIMDSPYSAWLAVCMLSTAGQVWNKVRSQVWNQVWNQVRSQVESQVGNQVGNQVWSQVRDQVENQVESQVESQVRSQVESQVDSQVWNQVGNQVWNQVRSQVENQVENQVGSQVDSQVWNQVGSQVWKQVRSQVQSQVWKQVKSQVRDQVENQVENQVESQVRSQVGNQVGNQVRSQVENQVENQVGSQVDNQVWKQVRSQVQSQVWKQVKSQVRDQVENQVESQVGSQVDNYCHPYIDGHLFASYFSLYSYCKDVLNVNCDSITDEKYQWYESTLQIGNFYPLDHVCVISQKPISIKMNDEGLLHCDGGPSIEYADGFKVWSLNGLRVPQYLAETPAGNLDLDFFKKETNADIKAEFIKKYGIERLTSFGTVIDSYKNYDKLNKYWRESEYELLDMAPIHDGLNKALYLKMKNLSVPGLYHVEGVSNDCRTIHDAIKDRWEEYEEYETISIK